MSQLLHDIVDAGCVLQNVHALCVWIVPYRERALNGLCKLPEKFKVKKVIITFCNPIILFNNLFNYYYAHTPHFHFCFLKGVRNKVHVLKGGDDALLVARHVGVKGQDSGVS